MQLFRQIKTVLSHPNNRKQKFYTLFLLVWWKLNQMVFKLPAVVSLFKDLNIICYPHSSYGSFVVYSKFPEYFEMNFFYSVIREKDTVLDVGANIGAMSLLAAHKAKKGKVFAFEPTPELLSYLRQNSSLNNFTRRISIQQTAVSNKVGQCSFVTNTQSEINHLSPGTDTTSESILVKATTLDSFCKSKKIRTVNVLKIDVEGAEPLVFDGAKSLLKQKAIEIIMFELNTNLTHFNSSPDRIFSTLKDDFFIFEFDGKGKLLLISDQISYKSTVNLVAVRKDITVVKRVLPYLSYVSHA